MRFVIAVVVCFVEIAAYGVVLALLGSTGVAKEAGPIGGILATAPLALLLGATWSGITKQAFPSSLDPVGIVSQGRSSKSHCKKGVALGKNDAELKA